MNQDEYDALILRAQREYNERRGAGPQIQLELDIATALYLIGSLQLALRHPENRGVSAAVARETVDGLIEAMREQGFPAHAELASLGDVSEPEKELVTLQ